MAQKKDQRFTISLDQETLDLLEELAEEMADGNKSQAARRAIHTAARVLLNQPTVLATRRVNYAAQPT